MTPKNLLTASPQKALQPFAMEFDSYENVLTSQLALRQTEVVLRGGSTSLGFRVAEVILGYGFEVWA